MDKLMDAQSLVQALLDGIDLPGYGEESDPDEFSTHETQIECTMYVSLADEADGVTIDHIARAVSSPPISVISKVRTVEGETAKYVIALSGPREAVEPYMDAMDAVEPFMPASMEFRVLKRERRDSNPGPTV